MEAYSRTTTNTTAVLSYLGAWTATLHADGYMSGVYSSDSSGIVDLVAQTGTAFAEPDDLWVANWNGAQSTVDANVPVTDWANHQRLHQYRGGHNDTYGGATLNVDSDYVDAATAAAGTGSGTTPVIGPPPAPSLTVTPTPNGTLQMTPSWTGEAGIGFWQLEGGDSPTSLTAIGTRVNAARTTPINVRNSYAYYQVLALDSTGQTLGTSATIPTPAHVAMFGLNAYVPRQGQGGVPVACFESQSCRVTVKIHDGKRTVSNTGPQSIAAGGGVAHFKLSSYWHKLIASHKPLPVTITIASTLAGQTSQAMKLVPYTDDRPAPVAERHPELADQARRRHGVRLPRLVRRRAGGVRIDRSLPRLDDDHRPRQGDRTYQPAAARRRDGRIPALHADRTGASAARPHDVQPAAGPGPGLKPGRRRGRRRERLGGVGRIGSGHAGLVLEPGAA